MSDRIHSCMHQAIFILNISFYFQVETIGDAYMLASGLPERNGNKHVVEIARTALALLNAVVTFKVPHKLEENLKLRIGIHSGEGCTLYKLVLREGGEKIMTNLMQVEKSL